MSCGEIAMPDNNREAILCYWTFVGLLPGADPGGGGGKGAMPTPLPAKTSHKKSGGPLYFMLLASPPPLPTPQPPPVDSPGFNEISP